MDEKELYVYADFSLSAVQQLSTQLKSLEYRVREVSGGSQAMQAVVDGKAHVIIVLDKNMDIELLNILVKRAPIAKSFLYFIGDPELILSNKAVFLQKAPGVHFSGLPINYNALVEAIEYNTREKKRVLVVDDEPIMLRSVKVWLGNDYEVSLVNSGETAIEFLNKHPVDLVLLDYRMPGMTGPDVLKALRQNDLTKRLPIIFLTGKNDKESIVPVMALKPTGYLLKSKPPEEIKAAVSEFFATRIIAY